MTAPPSPREHLARRLLAVADGERDALRDVYDLTAAKLLGVCLRILGDRDEAEDVLQDVYIAVWNKADRFDPARASPITWLATIARNRAIDRLRQRGSRGGTVPVEAAEAVADDAPDALILLEGRQEAQRLRGCLGELDERSRGLIASAFFDGRTYDDLARSGAMPLGTVKSIVRRGLQRLKGCLEA
ncbi:sigma-70 family RNA polymerase sigma factor [Aureimonas sp. AU4]|uniref:sigma-70 family RNA polymerase sigma factor n=1 Tax=Aureimonas sp. AU4 TaxID=1638163 RepID=UPI0007813EDD|nr:sigma-70 family RNA polymerase sigma factor [Aureimonas sp. AU4]